MINEIHIYNNKNFKRVNKTKALNAYYNNKMVLFLSSNMSFNNIWSKPFEITNNQGDNITFNAHINNFAYYNCNNNQGRYIKFYIEEV